jgi:Dolichyl-phosphate-mannose-protein mannosyltransferase
VLSSRPLAARILRSLRSTSALLPPSMAPQRIHTPLGQHVPRMPRKLSDYHWGLGVLAVVLVALVLRLHGIHDPLLDHPGWRQGDTAAIARNFDRLQFNIMYPQTMYNGPPPNYVELELQIVPFLAATLYKIFGLHEIFGRMITLGFSLATVVTLAYFARWLFGSAVAGLTAAFFYAVFPGSVYYGRTFMPDSAMVFFLTAALYAATRHLTGDALSRRGLTGTTALLTVAYLAKPVAVLAVVPLVGMAGERIRAGRATRPTVVAILLLVPLLLVAMYDRRVASYAEWHWAGGITQLHVLPALRSALTSTAGFAMKLGNLGEVLAMLRATLLGEFGFLLTVAGVVALPWIRSRSKALLWGWLAGGLAYVYVVVTVERADYYMLPLLPLCALIIGGLVARFVASVRAADVAPGARYALLALVPLVAVTALAVSAAPVAAYYRYNQQAFRNAVELDRSLPKDALVVIGHYGPDVQYYVDRFGWEEDPELWTPFDEESAIRKGARYFISVEDNRLRRNLELCAWLTRFPVLRARAAWLVYETDPALAPPRAELFWRDFRNAERAGRGRAFLNARGLCRVTP